MYVNTPGNNVVILNGVRDSFRCRQRNKDKVDTFRFISYKKMLKENTIKQNGPAYHRMRQLERQHIKETRWLRLPQD